MYGQYKRITGLYEGSLTGKGLTFGGSLARTEATGYGLIYFVDEMVRDHGKSLKGSTVVISGSGNVAIYAVEKVHQLGGKVVALSDSNGYIYDAAGIKLDTVKRIKEVERGRISEYVKYHPEADYTEGKGIWNIKCDIALPCATQNELNENDAKTLIANGCFAVGEGANMPCTPEAAKIFINNQVMFAPGKAANAGGVATSALEMSQDSMRYCWTFDEVDSKLKNIMVNIYHNVSQTSQIYGSENNLIAGANIAGFLKVADAMLAQGIV